MCLGQRGGRWWSEEEDEEEGGRKCCMYSSCVAINDGREIFNGIKLKAAIDALEKIKSNETL